MGPAFPVAVGRLPAVPEIVHEVLGQEKQNLNLVVCGHVDAGKSTLMGHVLVKLGHVDQVRSQKTINCFGHSNVVCRNEYSLGPLFWSILVHCCCCCCAEGDAQVS